MSKLFVSTKSCQSNARHNNWWCKSYKRQTVTNNIMFCAKINKYYNHHLNDTTLSQHITNKYNKKMMIIHIFKKRTAQTKVSCVRV